MQNCTGLQSCRRSTGLRPIFLWGPPRRADPCVDAEGAVSGRNGDKARFNRNTCRKLAKRQRVRAFFAALHTPPMPAAATAAASRPAAPAQVRPAVPPAAAVAAPPAGVPKAKRAKPAVPFAGKYRIIDFTLSNCVNSGIFDVLILTQYRPHSLNDHIGRGQPWDLDRSFTGGIQILQPYKGRNDTDWYAGTADAVAQNISFVRRGRPDYVLILPWNITDEVKAQQSVVRDWGGRFAVAVPHLEIQDA